MAQAPGAWALRHRRGQLLSALDAALRSLLALEEPYAAWAGHSASAETALAAALPRQHGQVPGRPQPRGSAKSGMQQQQQEAAQQVQRGLEVRGEWLAQAAEQAAAVVRLGQSVLQFELSRCARCSAGASSV